ncbi:2,4-dihydroxyhept-2-ene-1,7-dioic acid aldolase [Enterocloster citroniae]|nr:2,4-dihydroxyhept-2-ene-1,7-dioic acid aldolase [Enterocloster citroniae]
MKQEIIKGKEVIGAFLSEIAAPNLLRIMQVSGLDFVIVDCEHGYFDFSQVAALAAVGNGIEFPVIVRVPSVSRDCIQKYLDAGVDGILVPMLETKEQAEHLVEYGKYAPDGKRGISTMRPHSNYNPGRLKDYTARANQRTMLFAQIETKKGVQNISQITEVKGIDGIFIGPNDLACDLGTMGDFSTQEMEACIDAVIEASQNAGISSGIITSKIDFIEQCRNKGMIMFSCDSELGLLKKGILEMKERVGI